MVPSAPSDAPNWVEVADLAVQRQLADVAEWMLWLTAAQLLLGIFGTIALIITLRESRRATATALKALHVQQSAERAVLVIKETSILRSVLSKADGLWHEVPEHFVIAPDSVLDVDVRLVARIENVGRTVALIRNKGTMIDQGAIPPASLLESKKQQKHQPVDVDGSTLLKSRPMALSQTQLEKCLSGSDSLWFMGRIEYDDLFGEPHVLQFAYTTTLKGAFPKLVEYDSPEYWVMT